ncbi:DMT family transporter [Thorsellia kenyensis]|uniref:DMT family transporter n=1 Tax=Thorsellia kenyensis TaxID=1549888 RepID=A0ABV6C7X5_9GAMM
MKKTSPLSQYQGAFFIILAGSAFAGVNAFTPYVASTFSLNASWIALYQYFFALIVMLPWLLKSGIGKHVKTDFFWRHFWRVILAVIGVHFWIKALTVPIPIGQGLSLLMISPLFVCLGAVFYLGETISTKRSLALITGFIGALIILNPWSDSFSYVMFFPLIAAFFWACHTVMLKNITGKDSALTIVFYLYILTLPFNFILAITDNLTQFSTFMWIKPNNTGLWYLFLLGALTALGQWSLAKAYSAADATYIQPFDYFKLPINVLLGYIFFGWGIDGLFLIGASLIILATLYLTFGDKPKLLK